MFRNKSVKMGHNALYYYEGIFRIDCLQFCFFYLYFEFCTSLGFVLGLTEMCVKLMNNVHTDFFWFLKLQVIYFLKTWLKLLF